jgi:hypothetical protein
MPNVLTIKSPDDVRISEREKLIRMNCRLSGNYAVHTRGQNVGEVLDLTKVVGAAGGTDQFWGKNGPRSVYITNIGESGFSMSIVPGADSLHWLLVIYSALATEHAAAVYEAGLLADLDITIEASGRSFD